MQRRGAVADRDGVASLNPLGQRRLEALDGRPLGEKIALQHRHDGIDVGAVDALAAVAEVTSRHSASTSSRSCGPVIQRSLLLLAYSKSADTARPRWPP